MRPIRTFSRALVLSIPLLVMLATTAFAEEAPVLEEPGVCAPWHRCVAMGVMGGFILYLAFLGLNWMIHRKGFDRVEHRQGSPDGVPVDRK